MLKHLSPTFTVWRLALRILHTLFPNVCSYCIGAKVLTHTERLLKPQCLLCSHWTDGLSLYLWSFKYLWFVCCKEMYLGLIIGVNSKHQITLLTPKELLSVSVLITAPCLTPRKTQVQKQGTKSVITWSSVFSFPASKKVIRFSLCFYDA